MSYDELSVFGRLRKVNRLGPVGMFRKLVYKWKEKLDIPEVSLNAEVILYSKIILHFVNIV